MKPNTLALIPWMVCSTAAYAQTRSADVLYTHRETIPQRAYRVGDECFVPIDAVAEWGWKVDAVRDDASITAEGQTISLPLRLVSGRKTIALRKLVERLGGATEWVASSDTLQVYSVLSTLSVHGGEVKATSPLALKTFPFNLTNPTRTVIDLTGVRLGTATKQDLDPGVRAFQYRPNVVRLVWETPFVPQAAKLALDETRSLDIDVTPPDYHPAPAVAVVPPIVAPAIDDPLLRPLSIAVVDDSRDRTVFRIQTGGVARTRAEFSKPDPSTLQITIANVQAKVPSDFLSPTESVIGMTARTEGSATVVTLTLARPMGAEVSGEDGSVTVSLMKPDVGDGRLAGKLIVVDPGHGGRDNGSRSAGVREKDLNLIVGRLVSQRLAAAGATVILTRKTDEFIPLIERSDISNRNHADLFISCHINSTGGSGSQSGSITFHHKGNSTGRVLAECIQAEIARVNQLPNLGVWSDGQIYQSGFSVLRHTKAPAAVLLELGFINHPRDRKRITTDDFQRNIADAVVKGVRVFLGEGKSNE